MSTTTNAVVPPAASDVIPDGRLSRASLAALRIGLGLLWIQNSGWKIPPNFGQAGERPSGLFEFTSLAVEHPVFPPYSWAVENIVLPNLTLFGWMVLLLEAALGGFLLVGLATRLFALLAMAQVVAISLSVLNAPGEWHWAYILMFLGHVAIFGLAAGRTAGLDGLLRPHWQASSSPLAKVLVKAS